MQSKRTTYLTAMSILLTMMLIFTACAAPAAPAADAAPTAQAPAPGLYTPGTYTASAMGNNGEITVEVSFDANAITAVTVVSHNETAGISDPAIERIPQTIVEYQSLGVDAVSGATNTSNGILQAVESCVGEAGGDAAALKAVPAAAETAGELVEKTADVVIIGGGGAGVTAAVAAAQNGASVIVVEKAAMLGGNTILAGGKMNAVVPETQKNHTMTASQMEEVKRLANLEAKGEDMARWQKALKSQLSEYEAAGATYLFDSPELHMIQTYVDGDYYGNPALIEVMCQRAPETFHWMEELGYVWNPESEMVVGALWPRSQHGLNYKSGIGFIEIYTKNIEENAYPVEFITEVKADELVMENGRVTSVKATGPNGTPYQFHANKGVVLATGGFAANVEMREKYNTIWPYLGDKLPTTNAPSITGDGIIMAEAVGANLVDMDKIQLAPISDPVSGGPANLVGLSTGLFVNTEGKRFINEDDRRDVLSAAILAQPDATMYIISCAANSGLDENQLNPYGNHIDDIIAKGVVRKADTLEDLAKQLNMDPVVLQQTVDQYNKAVIEDYDPAFNRKVFVKGYEILEGPFYAHQNNPSVHHTMGGVEVDVDTHVINKNGDIIPGLYAAGEVTGGFHGGNRLGANAIADALSNGRIAGTMAATE